MAKLITKGLPCSFPHLFTAYAAFQGNKEKFVVTLLVDKSDKETIQKIQEAYDAAILEGLNKKFNGKMPNKASLRQILVDGDTKDRPEFKGKFLFTTASPNKPEIVDLELNPIYDEKAIVGGDIIRVSCNLVAYNFGGQRGVTAYLQNVQLVEKSKTPFSSKSTASSDFASTNNKDFL